MVDPLGTVTDLESAATGGLTTLSGPASVTWSIGGGVASGSWDTEVSHTFFAGPTSGGPAQPTWRAIVGTDVPTLNQTTTGSAAKLTTARAIAGVNFDGSADIAVPHSGLTGLTSGDDHTQYSLLAGRAGGQTLKGGINSGDGLTLISTNHATKGSILFGTSRYDEVNNRLGLGMTPTYALDLTSTTASDGNVRIENASSSGFSAIIYANNSGTTTALIGNDNANGRFRFNSISNQPIAIMTNSVEHLRIDTAGHLNTMGTAPTITCTGTGTSPAAPTIVGNDQAFIITMNTGTGSPGNTGTCTITFATAYTTNSPVIICMLVDGASAWSNEAVIRQSTQSASAPVLTWTNEATGVLTGLTVSSSYKIGCHVFGWL
jgi:hypothetical protein